LGVGCDLQSGATVKRLLPILLLTGCAIHRTPHPQAFITIYTVSTDYSHPCDPTKAPKVDAPPIFSTPRHVVKTIMVCRQVP
jgi:hypothetical protein